jgi:mannose-6-phosphate isomerase-like protein (cupin superfamily)
MDEQGLLRWVDDYEHAWRSAGTDGLALLFTEDATYLQSPYASPVVGLDAITAMWDGERDGPAEVFTMTREVVSVAGDTGVVRVLVRYGRPVRQEYLDLWVVRFAADGRAAAFEEWPFWPTHGEGPERPPAYVVRASEVGAAPWSEVVRSAALSAGVYRLPVGSADPQRPHDEDEIYVVLGGEAVLDVDGERHPVRSGSLAFVPARERHRFVDITADLEVAVVFAPPETPTD